MKRLSIFTAWMVAAFAVLVTATACPGTGANEYQAATVAYNADAVRYDAARGVFVDDSGNKRPAIRADHWQQFRDAEQAVITANAAAYADLRSWERTGVKPPTYDGNAEILAAAQQRVITLSQGVQ